MKNEGNEFLLAGTEAKSLFDASASYGSGTEKLLHELARLHVGYEERWMAVLVWNEIAYGIRAGINWMRTGNDFGHK
jgi:hypothetical protein